jgi:hypothetical protein
VVVMLMIQQILSRRFVSAVFAVSLALSAADVSAAGKAPTPKEAKVNTIIAMINSESNFVYKNYSGYTKVINAKTGPTCKELDLQRMIGGMGDSAPDRYKGYRKAFAKAPKLEVDAQVLDMLSAVEALYKPGNEASEYYFKREFTKDNCKRGIELHKDLIANWTKFIEAERVVRAFLDKYTDERDVEELAKTQKKYGKGLHYYHNKLMMDAKSLVRLTDASPFDAAKMKTQLEAYDVAVGEAQALVKKEKEAKKNAEAIYQGGYQSFVDRASRYKDSIKELLRVVDEEAKDPKAAKTMPDRRKRSFENLITSYNGLVDQSNGVMYSKTMK